MITQSGKVVALGLGISSYQISKGNVVGDADDVPVYPELAVLVDNLGKPNVDLIYLQSHSRGKYGTVFTKLILKEQRWNAELHGINSTLRTLHTP